MARATGVEWTGLEALKAALRQLPAELAGEASHHVEAAANSAAVAIKANYARHRRTGGLQDSVEVRTLQSGRFGAGSMVIATAKHAHLFEYGTQARHRTSGAATGAMWGKTPPVHAFIPPVQKARRWMYEQLKAVLEREGLVVTGDAG